MAFRYVLLPTSVVVACALLTGTARAQVASPDPGCTGPGSYGPFRHRANIPKPPPDWNYYRLPGGPGLTTDYPFAGWPGYRGAFGSFFTNGPHLSRTAVPVYTPIPPALTDGGGVHPWNQRKRLGLGLGYFGWVGPYAASPRPRPVTVGVWSPYDPRAYAKSAKYQAGSAVSTASSACLTLSVRLPNGAAEVYVDGIKTSQTGAARMFESPAIDPGRAFRYELLARWTEGGATVERKRAATGKSGDVVVVDFTTADVDRPVR